MFHAFILVTFSYFITSFIEDILFKNLIAQLHLRTLFFLMKTFHPAIIIYSFKFVIQVLDIISLWLQSVSQFSRSVLSNSLWPHESQHARPPCPSPTPGVYANTCPSSWWCHPTISSSVIPFSYCPQSLPASGSFPMSHLFAWGGQSTGVSASNEYPGLISFSME